MKILITAATAGELSFFNHSTSLPGETQVQKAVTGVGAMHTLYNLMQLIGQHHPNLIIQTGIAGCFTPTISIGSAVTISSETTADMGVWEKNGYLDIFDMGFSDPDAAPYHGKQLINPHMNLLHNCGLPSVQAVTVNRITTLSADAELYKNHYGAAVESMEGAALHYVCLLQNIPFIQIRGISNLVGERDKSQWRIKEALTSASNAIHNLLLNLNPLP
jgi:futalosine hydrolase